MRYAIKTITIPWKPISYQQTIKMLLLLCVVCCGCVQLWPTSGEFPNDVSRNHWQNAKNSLTLIRVSTITTTTATNMWIPVLQKQETVEWEREKARGREKTKSRALEVSIMNYKQKRCTQIRSERHWTSSMRFVLLSLLHRIPSRDVSIVFYQFVLLPLSVEQRYANWQINCCVRWRF